MSLPEGSYSGPPGHFYVAVASRMVIPQSLNIEQVAIILMKAKKALQQLQFQWVILNKPTSGIGFVMFWDGNNLSDDGYCWMNRGRTDTIPTHQKSISIEATKFFDGYVPGEKHVTMTRTFYRFAGQQTSLYFVHYMSHPVGRKLIIICILDAPKKPIGPAIPVIKPTVKSPSPSEMIMSTNPNKPQKVRSGSASPIQIPLTTANIRPQSSPTTIRLSMPSQQPPPPPQQLRASPGKRTRNAPQKPNPMPEVPQDVHCDFDSWGPNDHCLNRLIKMDTFYTRLFSVTTGINQPKHGELWKESRKLLIDTLNEQLKKSQEELAQLQTQKPAFNRQVDFARLDQIDTPDELSMFVSHYGISNVNKL